MDQIEPTSTTTRPQPLPPTKTPLQKLTVTHLRLIDEIAYLSRLHARTAPRGGKWCQPSRRYLAEKCARSIWTISRATNDARFAPMVSHRQQRKRQGVWRTCKYWIISKHAWAWANGFHAALADRAWTRERSDAPTAAGNALKLAPAQPRAPNRTHTSEKRKELTPEKGGSAALAAVLIRIQARLDADAAT